MEFKRFGKISFSQSADGYGASGVITSVMTVSTYGYSTGENVIAPNAEVRLVCSDENIVPPVFYVTKRAISGNVTVWTCCDIMSKAEKQLTFEDSDFTNDKITVWSLLDKITEQCGFNYIDYSKLSPVLSEKLERSECENITARDVLEIIADALCGCWYGNGSTIIFIPFGNIVFTAKAECYSEIMYGAVRHFSRVICTDDEDVYISGTGDNSQTIVCKSHFASQDNADYILNNMLGDNAFYTYQAWSCKGKINCEAKISGWLYLGELILGDSALAFNSVTVSPSPTGLYFTASRNNVAEDEADYISSVRRQLERKVELNKINTNVAIRRDGLFLFENGYKSLTEDEQENAKYSFNVDKGITEYSGALISKTTLSSASINEDGTEVTINYGSKKYKYNIQRSQNSITDFSREEIKE